MHISQTILQLSVGLLKYPNVILWNDIDLSEVQYEPNRFHESSFCLGRWCARCPRRVTGDAVPRHAIRGDSNGGGQARTRIAQGAINSIILWAENNRCEAKWESFWFWALKVPVIVASAGYGLMLNLNLDWELALTGAVSAACVLIDGLYRPERGLWKFRQCSKW